MYMYGQLTPSPLSGTWQGTWPQQVYIYIYIYIYIYSTRPGTWPQQVFNFDSVSYVSSPILIRRTQPDRDGLRPRQKAVEEYNAERLGKRPGERLGKVAPQASGPAAALALGH